MGKLAVHVAINTGRLLLNYLGETGRLLYKMVSPLSHLGKNGCFLQNYELNMFAYPYSRLKWCMLRSLLKVNKSQGKVLFVNACLCIIVKWTISHSLYFLYFVSPDMHLLTWYDIISRSRVWNSCWKGNLQLFEYPFFNLLQRIYTKRRTLYFRDRVTII